MSETIIVAIISGISVAVPNLIANIVSNRKSTALINYKVDELDKKVHAHNNLIDRMYKVENRVTLLEEGIKRSKHFLFHY